MKIIDISHMKPQGSEVAIFQGLEHGANVSFFIVQFSPGKGSKKHRHPYEETFIILDGEIELDIDGEARRVGSETIAIVPANTWHEFKNCGGTPVQMVNLHPVPKMITE
jgi:quercetin dioxygenase-like cupin family protein